MNRLTHVCIALILPLLATQCAQAPKQAMGRTNYHPAHLAEPAAPNYQIASYQPGTAFVPPSPLEPTPLPARQPGYFNSPSTFGTGAPHIRARSYIMVNATTGAVLAAKNADTICTVASTQKLLTALIVAESGHLDKPVRVAASDLAVEPTKLGVKTGEVYTRRDLLIAFLVKSSNDVSNVLARDNAGSTAAFAQKMTARAHMLGATQSYFRNAHGLTASGQQSSARDMARIALAAYRNPVIRDAVRRRTFTFKYNNGRVITLKNTNEILGRMPECNGMKTGYTNLAGRCLVSSASRGGRDIILVQLGTKTEYIWDDGIAMMRWGLSR